MKRLLSLIPENWLMWLDAWSLAECDRRGLIIWADEVEDENN